MHVNDCFLVLVFISDTSVFLNKFAPSFPQSSNLYQQYFQGDFLCLTYNVPLHFSALFSIYIFFLLHLLSLDYDGKVGKV